MATSYTTNCGTSGNSEANYRSTRPMEPYPSKGPRSPHDHHDAAANNSEDLPKSVNFDPVQNSLQLQQRKKYLTAKYGAHQMSLIKKRLAVEMWVFEELGRLYHTELDDHDCKLELEEVLNLDTDDERRKYALEELTTAKESEEEVHKFVDELLKKAKTL